MMFETFEEYLDHGYFQPRNGHSFVEIIVRHGNSPQTKVLEGLIDEDQISGWLRDTDTKVHERCADRDKQKTSTFRLLISAHRRDPGLAPEPFPFSHSTYSDIVRIFRVPKAFLSFVASRTSIATEFKADEHSVGILANLSSHAIAIVHDPKTYTTNCFVIGLCEHQINRCKRELRALRSFAADPMLFASIWLDVFIETRARRSEGRRVGMGEIQLEIGTHWSVDVTRFASMALDFDGLTHKLTVLWSELAWDKYALKILINFQATVAAARQKYFLEDHGFLEIAHTGQVVEERLRNSKDFLYALQESTAMSTQLASIQLQTMYNIINQRDNRLNMAQAEASRQLAELSLHDSSIMRSIAIDSRNVALLTRRDSTDMRIIAAVTLAFLPGTFTATLFSTSFFNFGPRDDDRVVSSWIWLFWAVAVSLTVIVMAGWYGFSRRNNHESQKAFAHALPNDQRSIPIAANAIPTTGVNLGQIPPPLGSEMSQIYCPYDLNKVPSAPIQTRPRSTERTPTVPSQGTGLEGPLNLPRPIPSSKITRLGYKDDIDTCPCCARPLV